MSNLTEKVDYLTEKEIAAEVTRLNPNVTCIDFSSELTPFIKSFVPPENLILPKGCYYNSKNGITNKHNTIDGRYSTVTVFKVIK